MATTKPQNEIVITFAKDHQDLIAVTLFDVHGDKMKAAVRETGILELSDASDIKFAGKEAAKRTGQFKTLVEKLGLKRTPFLANGHQYFSYRMAEAA